MNKKQESFNYIFQISKSIVLQVGYYGVPYWPDKNYTSTIYRFTRGEITGLWAPDVLEWFYTAHCFYDKWYFWQAKDLPEGKYEEIKKDIEELKERYNYLEMLNNDDDKPFSKREMRKLLKMDIKTPDR